MPVRILELLTIFWMVLMNNTAFNFTYAKVKDVKSPVRGTSLSAGVDFFVPNDFNPQTIEPGESIFVPSGIKVKIPNNYALIAFNKSGVSLKKNLDIGACVVDSDYQGEIHLHLFNVGNVPTTIMPGEKLVQFLLMPIDLSTPHEVSVEDLYRSASERGTGGFGSTGTA